MSVSIGGRLTDGWFAAAAASGLAWNARLRDAGGRAFAVSLVATQVARLVADRVRARLHVGL